ncbi:MAG: hypothetical protein ABIO57_01890 [Candidatus Paceibacterota bacterium]
MKKVFILLSGLLFSLFSCHENHEQQQSNDFQNSPHATIAAEGAIGELPQWFGAFSEPVLATLLDSIKADYPHLVAETKVLDSIKGVKIDFIGMLHSSFGMQQPVSDTVIGKCQCAIGNLIDTSKYLFIGAEHSTAHGRIRYQNLVQETVADVSKDAKLRYGIDTIIPAQRAVAVFERFRKYDYVVDRLMKNQQKPYVIGTNPYWINFAESEILKMDENSVSSSTRSKIINQFVPLLIRCRNEIALARTAEELLKKGRKKKAVVLYGADHLDDFKTLALKYGLVSKFILLKECELKLPN